jgi:hypothetical protein
MTSAEQTLGEVRRLRERARLVAHGGAWFPAAVLAALLLSSIALYEDPFRQVNQFLGDSGWVGLPATERGAVASYVFWLIGTPVAFALIGLWYRWHARRTGMRVPWRWFAAAGLGTLAALVVTAALPVYPTSLAAQYELSAEPPDYVWLWALRTPLLPIAAAVTVLGWVERSRAVALAGVWVGLIAWWQNFVGIGRMPNWETWLLSGGDGPALGGELSLLGLNRPGPLLIMMTLPLLVFAAVRAHRAHRAQRGAR